MLYGAGFRLFGFGSGRRPNDRNTEIPKPGTQGPGTQGPGRSPVSGKPVARKSQRRAGASCGREYRTLVLEECQPEITEIPKPGTQGSAPKGRGTQGSHPGVGVSAEADLCGRLDCDPT